MDPIDLKERFGDQFKVEYEESYYAVRSKRTIEEPWLMILLCQNGHICPWGGSDLAACTDRPGRIVNKLKALPFRRASHSRHKAPWGYFPLHTPPAVLR